MNTSHQIHPEHQPRSALSPILVTVIILIVYALCQTGRVNAQQVKKDDSILPFDTAKTSVTIFPISLAGHLSKDVADVIGLFLEKAAVRNIETVTAEFISPSVDTAEKTGAAFAEFIRNNPVDTDYAIYGEFLGSPKTGVKEVRTIVVDKSGTLLWSDSQTPENAAFKKVQPRNPMTCSVLMAEKLRYKFGLKEQEDAPRGKMAELWDQKSGLPSEEERSAMKERQDILKKTGTASTLEVLPLQIRSESSRENAEHLAALLNEDNICQARVSNKDLHLEIQGNSNEQRVLWDMARAFRDYVKANPPGAEYALYADYAVFSEQVRFVHFVVCDRTGEWVIVDFQNEYQPDFKKIDPKSEQDCDRLVARRFQQYLK
ncbi:MAG: hypothetical protein ABIH23_21950 [bacterium]